MELTIDASSIRAGGGLTHLTELLNAAEPAMHDINKINVWACQSTLNRLPSKSFIRKCHHPLLEQNILLRTYWQQRILAKELTNGTNVLFVPGGLYTGKFEPLVTMARNLLPFDEKEAARFGSWKMRARYRLLRFGQTRTFSGSSGVIYVSRYLQAAVELYLDGEAPESQVISHGLNARFSAEPRQQLAYDKFSFESPFKLLYVSIVNAYKHQWNVVKAVAKLRDEGVPVVLELVGPAEPRSLRKLEQSIRDHDPSGCFVTYRGPIPFEELHQAYHDADAFVFASSCESFGQILIEAMAAGLPVASSNMSCMPEIVGDAGVFFDPLDSNGIADTIELLVRDQELRAELVQRSVVRAEEFSWSRCADATFGFIHQVAERHKY